MDVLYTAPEPVITPYEVWNRFDPGDPYHFADSSAKTTDSGTSLVTKRVKTLDFRRRVRKGELIPHTYFEQTYDRRTFQSENTGFVYSVDGSSYFENRIGAGWFGIDVFPPSYVPEAVKEKYMTSYATDLDIQVQAAAEKLYRGFDALTFAAEMRRLVTMLQNVIPKILDFSTRLPKGYDMANLWLEGRYGWRPLMLDIKAIHETFSGARARARILSERAGFMTYAQEDYAPYEFFRTYWGDSVLTGTTYMRAKVEIGVRGSVAAQFATPMPVTLNPALTAWELTRFSWVFDWVIDITRWLCSVSLIYQAQAVTSSSGLYCRIEAVADVEFTATGHGRFKNPSHQGSATHWFNLRTPRSIPQSPFLHLNLDIAKLIDLLALLIQFRTKGGKTWK
jgi:hypothetical protein